MQRAETKSRSQHLSQQLVALLLLQEVPQPALLPLQASLLLLQLTELPGDTSELSSYLGRVWGWVVG